MKRIERTTLFIGLVVLLGLLAIAPGLPVNAAAPSGAIFTTTPDGSIVNENVRYESKLEVYLDGGPGPNAPQDAAGLDDGFYVFQVTDPSGWVLLSMDPSKCRVVEVADGVITRLVNPTELGLADGYTDQDGNAIPACHIQDDPDGAAGASGRHDTNTDADYGPPAIVVQLMPFLDTPNPGGVYKAWMIGLDDYVADGGDLTDVPGDSNSELVRKRGEVLGYDEDPGFGPPRNDSKTDNFKVKEVPPMIHVFKFEDLNGNGMKDPGEPEISGWEIQITETLYDGSTVTNVCYTPCWRTVAPDSTVSVTEIIPDSSWELSYVTIDDIYVSPPSVTVDVTFNPGDMAHYVTFGNWQYAEKKGMKFHDLDGDGVKDAGEPGLDGWTIKLFGTDGMGNSVSLQDVTDANGEYSISVPPGDYTVCEVLQSDWYQSFPASGADCSSIDSAYGPVGYDITLISGEVDAGNDFGNYQFAEKKGMKFHDLDGDGAKDAGEPGLDGWTIKLFGTDGMGNSVSVQDTTDANGEYSISVPPGNYTVCEVLQSDWFQSFPASGADCASIDSAYGPVGYAISLISQEIEKDNDFGNYQLATKAGAKFWDVNKNSQRDAGEPGLEGWLIHLFGTDGMGNSVNRLEYTDASGEYSFDVPPGNYTVCEIIFKEGVVDFTGWTQTFPTAGADCSAYDAAHGAIHGPVGYAITLISQDFEGDNDFGNRPAEGCTPGYWKQEQHFDSWVGHLPGDPLFGLFSGVGVEPYLSHVANLDSGGSAIMGSASLVEALQFGGGDTIADKAEILLRAAVAGVLNADNPGVDYPWTSASIVDAVNAALASQDATQIINLATDLDGDNNGPGGCPLN
jgi:hypothetical protein